LPGPFDTDRLRSTIATVAKASGRSIEDVTRERQAQNPAGRFGTAAEFGEVCAFVCSAQAGYITGQNFVPVDPSRTTAWPRRPDIPSRHPYG
jgi:3-oxoacyl-[acyl-carrier protein] reductase